jgi:glycosyltransferase involved in cell wall biosynthesis
MACAVSVLVATRNRERLLAQTLDALLAQEWPRAEYEIIVADNGSADGTSEVVARAARRSGATCVRYLHVPTPGKSIAVNTAIAQAAGDLLAFTDDDVLPAAEWLRALHAAVDETDADFVAGRTLPRWESAPPRWMSPALYGVLAVADGGGQRFMIDRATTRIVPVGANLAVRRSLLARIGGFRHDLGKLEGTLRTGEDHELFLRMLHAGARGVYEPTAVVRHWVGRERLVPSYVQRWLFQNGRDVAQLQAAFPSASPMLLGVPRYLWREAVESVCRTAWAVVRTDRASGFAAAMRLVWITGFVSQAWSRPGSSTAAPMPAGGEL